MNLKTTGNLLFLEFEEPKIIPELLCKVTPKLYSGYVGTYILLTKSNKLKQPNSSSQLLQTEYNISCTTSHCIL